MEPTEANGPGGTVTRAVIEGISCEDIEDDAFLRVEDGDGRRGNLINGNGVQISAGEDQIVLEGEGSAAIPVENVNGLTLRGTLTILGSQGFNCTATDSGGNGTGGDDDVSGDDSENNSEEVTVIRENTVIRETIPNDDLPDTGGTSGDASMAGLFAGAGAFVLLGAMVVRVYRFRNS